MILIYPTGDMNVCTMFYGNRSKGCQDISQNNLINQVSRIHFHGTMNGCTKFHDNQSNSC